MMEIAKRNNDKERMLNTSKNMLDIIQDLNKVLGSNE